MSKSIGRKVLEAYDLDNLTIATFCSSASKQIFQGARALGFKSLGIMEGKDDPHWYDAFPGGKPDDFFVVETYKDILKPEVQKKLRDRNAYFVPTGTNQEELKEGNQDVELPYHGIRYSMRLELNRSEQRKWLKDIAGLPMADIVKPSEIKIGKQYLIKRDGAKGGEGFFLVTSQNDYDEQITSRTGDGRLLVGEHLTIQEFLDGPRYYIHFFQDPLSKEGYGCGKGHLELRGCDVRIESTADGRARIVSMLPPEKQNDPTFVVTGNSALVLRESLLKKALPQGKMVVDASRKLFRDNEEMIGPFCLETVVTNDLQIRPIEITGRQFGGTNAATDHWYAELSDAGTGRERAGRPMHMGERIVYQIRQAIEMDRLEEITS